MKSVKEMKSRDIKYSDIALFYRTNAQSRILEISLRNHAIPYIIVGGVSFYQRKEIKDILSYLRLCINPHDGAAMERIINVPLRGIGETTVKKLKDRANAKNISLFDAMCQIDTIPEIKRQAAASIRKLTEIITGLQRVQGSPVENIIRRVIEETGYRNFLKESGDRESADRISNIDELINAAHEYDLDFYEGNLQGFLEEVALVSDTDTLENDSEGITLMTLHTAKGLEFPVVFITGMEEGLLPHTESNDSDDEVEEERRLCYVGITRAMKELYLTYARRRTRHGQMNLCVRSRFLDEIPAEVIVTTDRIFQNHTSRFNATFEEKDPPYNEDTFESDPYDMVSPRSVPGGHMATSGFSRGEIIRHPLFGTGRILEISGSKEKTYAKIHFNIGGIKSLMLAYAKLEKLGRK